MSRRRGGRRMRRIQLDITRVNANKFVVGNRIMTYLELVEWFKDRIASDDSEEK